MARNRTKRGRHYEDLAAAYLEAQGIVIAERNVRIGNHEIDLIADDGDTLVFVEVRGRKSSTFIHPAATVDAAKQQHLVTAAEGYLRKFRITDRPCRFDVVTVVAPPGEEPEIEHFPSAFMAR